MMSPYFVVVDNAPAARIVERILADPHARVVNARVRSSAMMRASGILQDEGAPTVLLLDSDSLEERAIVEEQLETGGYLRRGSAGHPNRLVLAIPQVEAVLFSDRTGLEKALGRELSEDEAFEARFRPRAVFHRILGDQSDVQERAVEVIGRIDDVSLRRMAAHAVIREIQGFVEDARSGRAKATRVRRAS